MRHQLEPNNKDLEKGLYIPITIIIAELLKEICKDVVIEPALLPLTGETLPTGSNLSDGASREENRVYASTDSSREGFIDSCSV